MAYAGDLADALAYRSITRNHEAHSDYAILAIRFKESVTRRAYWRHNMALGAAAMGLQDQLLYDAIASPFGVSVAFSVSPLLGSRLYTLTAEWGVEPLAS